MLKIIRNDQILPGLVKSYYLNLILKMRMVEPCVVPLPVNLKKYIKQLLWQLNEFEMCRRVNRFQNQSLILLKKNLNSDERFYY